MGMPPVIRAGTSEAPAIGALLADAFHNDPVSRWLMPDDADRRRRHPEFSRASAEHALDPDHGEVHVQYDNGYISAALWLHAGTSDDAGADMVGIAQALGSENFERFMALDELMRRHHPPGVEHAYLDFIAVAPPWQGQGVGSFLLERKLVELDAAGTPAYLVASTDRTRSRLYPRFGFRSLGDPFALPDGGPLMYPMLREPRQRQAVNSRWVGWPS